VDGAFRKAPGTSLARIEWGQEMANQLGRRYVCEVCGTESLCTKAGEGEITCDGQSMKLQVPKALPSSD